MESVFYRRKYDSIQALRGIAALSVVLHHISFIENGSFGVDIFFCISGFIMMYVTHISTEHFILKRIIRIVPLYWSITILTYIAMLIFPHFFQNSTSDITILIRSLLFIPCHNGDAIQPIVRVGWTLNYEIFFYVVLWIALMINKKYRMLIASGILVLFAVAGMIFNFQATIPVFYTNTIIIEFIFGMLAYEILKRLDYEEETRGAGWLIIISVLCYVFMFAVKYLDILNDMNRVVVYGIPAFVLFISAFTALYDKKIPKIFVFFGDISYSVYLVHYFIARIYDRILITYGYENVLLRLAAILVFVCAIGVGSASYYLFEIKLNKALRRKFRV